ncbi:MAG: SCO family protein [Flavobacteriaceae bacterium]|nr:SCO family protein [Flavobacteriaceae bacterium]|tara:strand:+ start:478 stop:1107 length:630 start_codon:yes stop_codon:yes gene_type:complete
MFRFFLLAILVVYMSSCSQLIKKELPVFNPSDFDPKLVDTSLRKVNQNHTVKDFNLTNQNGVKISSKDYENKVYVVDFFFTRCPSICPIMTDNMLLIQNEFIKDDQIMLLSLSVTPEIDSVSVLKKYAVEKGIEDSKWNITTGSKKHIYELARKSYFAVVDQGDGDLQDFIHTPNFILVDKKKQIRGIYNGTELSEVTRLIEDIHTLIN